MYLKGNTIILGNSHTGKTQIALDIIKSTRSEYKKILIISSLNEYNSVIKDKTIFKYKNDIIDTCKYENCLFVIDQELFRFSKELKKIWYMKKTFNIHFIIVETKVMQEFKFIFDGSDNVIYTSPEVYEKYNKLFKLI